MVRREILVIKSGDIIFLLYIKSSILATRRDVAREMKATGNKSGLRVEMAKVSHNGPCIAKHSVLQAHNVHVHGALEKNVFITRAGFYINV